MPAGAGDASVQGEPARGKPYQFAVEFPASLLKAGNNQVDIANVAGSWVLYDSVAMETPAGVESMPVAGAVTMRSAQAEPTLVERGGKLFQPVTAALVCFGGAEEASVQLNGTEVSRVQLRKGTQKIEALTPGVEKETTAALALVIGGKTVASQQVTLKPVRKWVVYLLPHSHVDIGYTHVQSEVEKAQWKYLEMGMEAAKQSANNPPGARFKWNVEVLWAVDSYLRQATPEKQQAFFDAVKAGQVGLQALYGNELTGLCRSEELLRLTGYAQKLSQRIGVPIESAMITDVPGYTWGMVPAFAHSGVKYWSIGPNGGDRIGYTTAAWGDKPFWWIGPNGKDKVLVWMTGTGYYRVFSSGENLMNYLGRLEQSGYPYDFVQVRHCLGDNGAPDVTFADTVKQWNATHAYPKLVIATTEDMFHDFEQRYGDRIPTAQGDFTPYWEDGAPSSARETALNRAAADRLTQAETLFAMLNPKVYPAEDFYQAWRNVILYDEHTWGAHNSISQPDLAFVKDQWKCKQSFALDAGKQSRDLLDKALGGTLSSATSSVDVFNTASWPRTDLVTLRKETKGDAVRDESGQAVPSQRLSTGELVFLARDVPSFGARRFTIAAGAPGARGKAAVSGLTLATTALTVKLDENSGDIVSLRSATLDAELADGPVNNYLSLPGGDVKNVKPSGPAKVTVKEAGPLVVSLVAESDAPGCNRLAREVRLVDGLDRVEIVDLVDKKAVRSVEGVHFGFSFNLPDPQVHINSPGTIGQPEVDQLPGACKNWFCVERWVDISNPVRGVTWATADAPLMELGGLTANLPRGQPDPDAYLKTIKPSSKIYSWAMNNHWHTNYRADQEGPTWFHFAIRPHGAYDPVAATRFGIESTQPLVVAPASGQAPVASRLSLEPAHVLATAFKPSDDGKALIVRLFNPTSQPQTTRLKWSRPVRETLLSNAREDSGPKAPEAIALPKLGMVTLRVEQ